MQSSLFDDGGTAFQPARDRAEPDVWIRRLRIINKLAPDAKTIREIEFRLGLNIIRTAERKAGDNRPVGHSVGKSLLVRLIRYCLGEPTFCTKEVRAAITAKDNLFSAFVLAEVHVGGEPWVVARPIGNESAASASWAAPGDQMDVLLVDAEGRLRFSEFMKHLRRVTAHCLPHPKLPNRKEALDWLHLLAWLARDQNCRFRHHHEWRDSESESGTGQLPREDASLLIRMVMDLLDNEEMQLRARHDELLKRQAELESRERGDRVYLDRNETELRRLLKLETEVPGQQLFGAVAVQRAERLERSFRGLYRDFQADPRVANLDADKTEAAAAVAVAENNLNRLKGEEQTAATYLEQLEATSSEDYYAKFAEQGDWCPIHGPKERALANGCPGDPGGLKPGERDPQHQAKIEESKRHLALLREQVRSTEEGVSKRKQQATHASEQHQAAQRDKEKRLAAVRQKIGQYKEWAAQANRHDQGWRDLVAFQGKGEALVGQIEKSRELQQKVRKELESRQAALSGHFDSVLKHLLGPEAGGTIEINMNGIRPCPNSAVAASGEALSTSATVLGFDLACLRASICGLGHFPRLLIHDSPREADMEEEMYHGLFRLIAGWEEAFKGQHPSFQYIVTTTTPPDSRLNREPFIRGELSTRADDGLLLRTKM